MFDDAHGALSIVITYEHRNRVECIEEEVWIQLRLKCSETRARELFGEPGHLHFALAGVDEITRGVFDSYDAEINSNAERQRSKDPAQPFSSNVSKVSSQDQA